MKKPLILVSLFSLACGFGLAACDDDGGKNVCEQAADILVDDCGFDAEGGSNGQGGGCEGQAEAASQCIVDYPDQACASLSDPLNTDAYADYAECVMNAS